MGKAIEYPVHISLHISRRSPQIRAACLRLDEVINEDIERRKAENWFFYNVNQLHSMAPELQYSDLQEIVKQVQGRNYFEVIHRGRSSQDSQRP